MSRREYESSEKAQEIVKEAFWLAWQACGSPMGMGKDGE